MHLLVILGYVICELADSNWKCLKYCKQGRMIDVEDICQIKKQYRYEYHALIYYIVGFEKIDFYF